MPSGFCTFRFSLNALIQEGPEKVRFEDEVDTKQPGHPLTNTMEMSEEGEILNI